MDLYLSEYDVEGSSKHSAPLQDGSSPEETNQSNLTIIPSCSSAPEIQSVGTVQALALKNKAVPKSRQELLASNTTADVMYAPLQGPLLPQQRWGGLEQAYEKNAVCGQVEKCFINDVAFDLQRHKFQRVGQAADPSDFARPNIVSKRTVVSGPETRHLQSVDPFSVASTTERSLVNKPYYLEKAKLYPGSSASSPISRKQRRQRRAQGGSASSESYLGPWAPPVVEEERRAFLEAEAQEQQKLHEATSAAQREASIAAGIAPTSDTTSAEVSGEGGQQPPVASQPAARITTIFHGRSEVNFQGLSWISRPQGFKERDEDQQNYLPKKLVHTYAGHSMGVQSIRFFPQSGHLLLSASMDSQCKIWDVYNQRKCLRTYMGHTMAVRDVQFADEGKKFYSCSFDKTMCLWDTEYGKIIGTFSNDKTPYCLSVHPGKGMDHVFIIGSSNKRAVQFDARTGEITQEYNEHLAAVNTVTFCEDGLRIATTADDKKMFIWEFGIPVVVKHIAEPHMHSMPAVRLHPSKKFLACQSMDNQIVVYEAAGRYRFQGPRRFRGHTSAGYAILPGFSPDGRFIMSGDASGKVWFWDWKTTKNHRTLQAHQRVCMGAEWHPTMVSRVATCGWDGLVKLWE